MTLKARVLSKGAMLTRVLLVSPRNGVRGDERLHWLLWSLDEI